MKTIFTLLAAAFFSVTIISCSKNQVLPNNNVGNTASTEPVISSKIYTRTNNPFTVNFGQAEAVFSAGDKVAVYLPYVITNDVLQNATITLTDAATEEVVGSFNLLPASNPALSDLRVPSDLSYVSFRFILIDLDNTYSGKTITMKTNLTGQFTSSADVLTNAFSVQ